MAAAPADIGLTETETDPRLATALAAAPIWDKQILELGLEWPELAELSADQQWAARRLRVFLLTWDPFEWQPGRASAFATSTNRSDDAGLVLYLPLWQAQAPSDGLAALLARLGESILTVAGELRATIADGSYPAGVQAGARPALLSRVPSSAVLESPRLSVVGPGWQAIQFDTLEDLAQDGFGPADLDRSPVRFKQPGAGLAGCPGCVGNSVGFPDGLKDAQEAICGPHRAEALRITTARLEASKASNPAGWEALLEAGQRLMEPHLPNGLGPRLDAAASVPTPSPAQVAEQASLVIAAAGLMSGLPDPQTPLGGRLARVRAWLELLADQAVAAGLADETVDAVTEAVGELLADPAAAAAQAAAQQAVADTAAAKPQPFRRPDRVGRNAPCPCGSGNKYKFCHGR